MSSILREREREREEWKWNGQQKREVIENHIKMNLYKMMDKTLDHVKMNVYIHSKERELNVFFFFFNFILWGWMFIKWEIIE